MVNDGEKIKENYDHKLPEEVKPSKEIVKVLKNQQDSIRKMTEEAEAMLKAQQELADKIRKEQDEADRVRSKRAYDFLEEKLRSKEAVDRLGYIGVFQNSKRDRDKRWDYYKQFDYYRDERKTLASTPGLPDIKQEFI